MSSFKLSSHSTLGTAIKHHGSHHKWVVLGVAFAAQASFAAAFAGVPVTAVLMRSAYQMTTEQLGLILGCIALGVTFSELIWGLLTDVFGDRKVLLTGLLTTALTLTSMALFVVPDQQHVPSSLLLGASLALVGVLGGSVNSSSGRAIMVWFSDSKRGLAMSIRQTAIPVGGAIGAALLPWLAQNHGFRWVFAALAAFCALSALMTWIWLHEPLATAQTAPAPVTTEARSPLRRFDIWRLAIASALLTAPQLAVLTFGGVFLHDLKAASLSTIVAAIVAVQIGGAVARILVGQLSDRGHDRRTLVRWLGLSTGVVAIGLAASTDADLQRVVPLLFLVGLLASAWHGVAYTEAAAMAGADRAGTALGIMGMTIFGSAFLTPALIPVVLAASSWSVVWGLIASAAFLAVMISPSAKSR